MDVFHFVKLLSCDQKVTGSSPGNRLLCKKNRVRLRTIHQMVGPFPDPAYVGTLVHRVALFFVRSISGFQIVPYWEAAIFYLAFRLAISIPSLLFLPSEACLVCFFCCVFRCCVALFSWFCFICSFFCLVLLWFYPNMCDHYMLFSV